MKTFVEVPQSITYKDILNKNSKVSNNNQSEIQSVIINNANQFNF